MESAVANRAPRTGSFVEETLFETGEGTRQSETISPRGLEILRVLDEVFNSLPSDLDDRRD